MTAPTAAPVTPRRGAAVYSRRAAACLIAWLAFAAPLPAQDGTVLSESEIGDGAGGFTGVLADGDAFGASVVRLGDVDGDGIDDLAVGATGDDGGGGNRGAVWILFMDAGGAVASHARISSAEGGFSTDVGNLDLFGAALAALGDVNGDAIPDLAIGVPQDDDGCCDDGAVWIVFLDTDGSVKAHQKISATAGGFTGELDFFERFGSAVAGLGDLDGDGVGDLAVGAKGHRNSLGSLTGAVWILFLNADGTVKSHQLIDTTEGGFTGSTVALGSALTCPGDLDRDGVPDLAAGDVVVGLQLGWVHILFLNADGTVKSSQRIGYNDGGLGNVLDSHDLFGFALSCVGDLDGDGVVDLAVGAPGDDDGASGAGALWMLFMKTDGTVRAAQKISATAGNFAGALVAGDMLGAAAHALGDVSGDGITDIVSGALGDDGGGSDRGSLWLMELDGAATAHWQDLGHALAGTAGKPTLVGASSLAGGDPIGVTLTGARPDAAAYLVVGVAAIDLPFHGGTLVPAFEPPLGSFVVLATDPSGSIVIDATWPVGLPPALSVHLQYWIVDPVAVGGLAASNAVVGTTP